MKERLSTARTGPLSKVFDYYSNVEEYPSRYSKYCVRVTVLEKQDNHLVTEEVWNFSFGNLDHVKIKVKYTFFPPDRFQYEIIDGYGKGIINEMKFEEEGNGKIAARLSWIPLDLLAHVYGDEDPYVSSIAQSLNRRDVENYEGKQVETRAGDPCPVCKKGKLCTTGKFDKWEKPTENRSGREFVCDYCSEIITHHEIGLKERIGISDSVSVKKFSSEDKT